MKPYQAVLNPRAAFFMRSISYHSKLLQFLQVLKDKHTNCPADHVSAGFFFVIFDQAVSATGLSEASAVFRGGFGITGAGNMPEYI